MERVVNCPVCGASENYSVLYDNHLAYRSFKGIVKQVLPVFDSLVPASFSSLKAKTKAKTFRGKVRICLSCGYGRLEKPPSLDSIKKYYEKDYWSDFRQIEKKKEIGHFSNDWRASSQIAYVAEKIDSNALTFSLEIGAGPAFASQLLKSRNNQLHAYVCEPGTSWNKYYSEVRIEKIADFFPFGGSTKFNYIHTSHWLEHVLDLDKTVNELNRCLTHGGCVFVEVPNTPKMYWQKSLGDTPHIHFFTPEALVKCFEANGFITIDCHALGNSIGSNAKAMSGDPNPNGVWVRGLFRKTTKA